MKSVNENPCLLEFSILPLGKGDSLSNEVARCTKIVRESGLKNELHSMGTVLEGDLAQCLNVVRQCVEAVQQSAPRVSASLRIDVRPGSSSGMKDRVASVESKLERS